MAELESTQSSGATAPTPWRVAVTGGASGIGLATVRALAEKRASVAVLDRDDTALNTVYSDLANAGVDVTCHRVDVSNESEVDKAFDRIQATWNGLDVVIHAAGIMREQRADIRQVGLDSWEQVLSVNLTGAFLVARAAARLMIPQGRGVVVLVGSTAGVTGASGSIPYGASKGGVNGLALGLAGHLGEHGIRVHNFCPGSIDTPLLQRSLEEGLTNGAPAEFTASVRARLASPDGVGRALALLASPDADYIRGPIFSR